MNEVMYERETIAEVIIDLYHALLIRNSCPTCGGVGGWFATVGDEVCECALKADEILRKYKDDFYQISGGWASAIGINPSEIHQQVKKFLDDGLSTD